MMQELPVKGRQRSVALFTLLLLAVVTFAVPAKSDLTHLLTLTDGSTPSTVTLLYEGLRSYTSTGDGSAELASSSTYLDYNGWSSFTKVYAGGTNNAQGNGGCLKLGSGSATGSMTTGDISLTGSGTLTFYLKKYTSDTGKLNVTVTGATADATEFTPASDWTLCTVNLTNATGVVTFTLATSSKRAYVDEITLTSSSSTAPSLAYYRNADGKKGSALKTAMCGIIYNRTEKSYDYLWTAFHTTDVRSDGKIWDMYSDITNYEPASKGETYHGEGDSYNREHSFPKSWFGGEVMPMFSDLHHIYPTDGYINGRRSNNPYGETNGETYKSANDFSKLGICTYPGYTSTVFEPADEYKGDFARTYFYMVTCYEEKLADWVTYYSATTEVEDVLDGKKYPGLTIWQLNMLMKWAKNDPVSEKETARNNAVYAIQNNRNPFIDYPGLEEYIWGSLTTTAFSYDNYVQPVYKQDVTMAFSPSEATATIGEDFTEPTLTTTPAGLTVTYSSSNTDVATINSSTGEVTLVAAGTTTITATFAGDDTYNEGTASYTLKVSESSSSGGVTLLYEGLSSYSGNDASQAMTTNYQYLDYKSWSSLTNVFAGGTSNANSNGGCLKFGSNGGNGSMTTGSISLTGNGKLTFYLKQYGSDTGKLNVTVTGATADVTQFTPASDWTLCTVNLSNAEGNVTITLATTSKRAYVDEITLTSNGTLDLANDGNNVSIIAAAADNGGKFNVTLKNRTLFKDGGWNTLTLPFSLSAAQIAACDLVGADIRTLSTASFSEGVLMLDFTPAIGNDPDNPAEGAVTAITAGTPYIIKWVSGGNNIVNPTFSGVTLDATTHNKTCDLGDGASITFCGTYGQLSYDNADQSILFLGESNTLYYPESGATTTIGAQRAYFKLTGIAAKDSAPGNGSNPVRTFVLNFDGKETGISLTTVLSPRGEGSIYSLSGVKVDKPVRKGLYIHNGRKMVIK